MTAVPPPTGPPDPDRPVPPTPSAVDRTDGPTRYVDAAGDLAGVYDPYARPEPTPRADRTRFVTSYDELHPGGDVHDVHDDLGTAGPGLDPRPAPGRFELDDAGGPAWGLLVYLVLVLVLVGALVLVPLLLT